MQLGTTTIPILPFVAVAGAAVLCMLVLWGVHRARRTPPPIAASAAHPVYQGAELQPCDADWTGEVANGYSDPPPVALAAPARPRTVAEAVAERNVNTAPLPAVREPEHAARPEQYAVPAAAVATGAVGAHALTGHSDATVSEELSAPADERPDAGTLAAVHRSDAAEQSVGGAAEPERVGEAAERGWPVGEAADVERPAEDDIEPDLPDAPSTEPAATPVAPPWSAVRRERADTDPDAVAAVAIGDRSSGGSIADDPAGAAAADGPAGASTSEAAGAAATVGVAADRAGTTDDDAPAGSTDDDDPAAATGADPAETPDPTDPTGRGATGGPVRVAGAAVPMPRAVQQALAARAVQRARKQRDGAESDEGRPDGEPGDAGQEQPLTVLPSTQRAPAARTGEADARDRLLSVLLADPAAAVGATEDLAQARDRVEQLDDVLRRRRADLAAAVRQLHESGLDRAQIGRLAGLGDEDVRAILESRSDDGADGPRHA